jgi:hypothetical protein
MLHGVEAEIGQLGGFGMAVDGDYAALFVEFILHGDGNVGQALSPAKVGQALSLANGALD